ncbi:MAG: hypothetical protein DI598_00775 [Pseudopedobacter saltans]|uniref:BioF2-like acetyltransferase domain-containing protein n=1 Tax=Pseudopedobacter saltans TaxID=151895 RepID=A0A2W5FFC6_9SPHI|nr:MAG: hypothetical protein DI598_00775 [Pseudopedobacter saltans]
MNISCKNKYNVLHYSITKVKRSDLDETKYTSCLQNALNYQIYAEIWVLDILSERKWFCYILNDYEAIFPIPYQIFWGIKVVSLPPIIQQLGIFYKKKLDKERFNSLIKKLKRNIVRGYSFNEDNTKNYPLQGEIRPNQLIKLNTSYENVASSYNRNRKRNLRDFANDKKIIYSQEIETFITLYKKEYPSLVSPKKIKLLYNLMEASFKNGAGYQYRIEENGELLSSLFYLEQNKKIYQLGASRIKKESFGSTFSVIIDYVLRIKSNQINVYDFEGSRIPGVHSFNKSFGAEEVQYTYYTNIALLNKLYSLIKNKS